MRLDASQVDCPALRNARQRQPATRPYPAERNPRASQNKRPRLLQGLLGEQLDHCGAGSPRHATPLADGRPVPPERVRPRPADRRHPSTASASVGFESGAPPAAGLATPRRLQIREPAGLRGRREAAVPLRCPQGLDRSIAYRRRAGIGSTSAARPGGAWKGSAKYWVSCVTRPSLISITLTEYVGTPS